MLEELREKQKQEVTLQEEMEALRDSLRLEKQNLAEMRLDCDRLKALCHERDTALQVQFACVIIIVFFFPFFFLISCFVFQAAISEKKSLEAKLTKLSSQASESTEKKDLLLANNQVWR